MHVMRHNEHLAYAAGIIDGEGCIGAYNVRQATSTKSPYAQVTIRVAMTSPLALKRLQSLFGGTLRAKKRINVKRMVFDWCVRNRHAEAALRQLLPYLCEKREQAEVALALAELRRGQKRTVRLTEADIAEREQYVQKLKDLKRVEYDASTIQ